MAHLAQILAKKHLKEELLYWKGLALIRSHVCLGRLALHIKEADIVLELVSVI